MARLNLLARTSAHQNFREFLRPEAEWKAMLASARGARVLIATNTGGHFAMSAIDRLLAVALTLRGARVTTLLCDAALPACQMMEFNLTTDVAAAAKRGPDTLLCGYCYAPAENRIKALGLTVARLGAFLSDAEKADARAAAHDTALADIATFQWRSVGVGEHALAGALRFFARADLANEICGEAMLRRYLEASILAAQASLAAIDSIQPEVMVMHHGIYVPQGLAAAAARARGVRVVTWNPAYRARCFIFSHEDTYHHTLMDEPTEAWRSHPFSANERQETLAYLNSRREGERDWIQFHRRPDYALTADLFRLGLDPTKPLALALTNVFWDAQLHYRANAFPSQFDWLANTIAWFAERPDLQLAIRIHPAEVSGSPASRQRAQDELARAFPALPENIIVIPPESSASTYALAHRADVALIYATKMGVELSAIGLPVIVAGEAWVRGKGFTTDVSSPDEYRTALERLPLGARLAPEQCELALRYARHFFFGRMIELPFVDSDPGPRRFSIHVRNLDELRVGASVGLDTICAGILNAESFVAPY